MRVPAEIIACRRFLSCDLRRLQVHRSRLSDHDHGRRLHFFRNIAEVSERSVHPLLIRHIGAREHAHRRFRIHSCLYEAFRDLTGFAVSHHENQRPLKPRQSSERFRCFSSPMSRHHGKRRSRPSVRHRDPEVLRCGNAGADAGNHLIGDAGLLKSQRLFAASAKDRRITPLEAHDPETSSRAVNQEFVDLFLLLLVGILALAHADQLTAGGRFLKQGPVQKIVINDDLRAAHSLKPPHCNQPRLAPRADDPHFSVHNTPRLYHYSCLNLQRRSVILRT